MPTSTQARPAAVDHARRSDARLALATAAGAVATFAVLVVVPWAVDDFSPPAGTGGLWGAGGMLALVLAPTAAALAAGVSGWALWRHGELDDTTRRLHLLALITVAAFAAFLVSGAGRDVILWWQD